nr:MULTISPECIES: sce7726 family protein [unclassified Nesterenkonia]
MLDDLVIRQALDSRLRRSNRDVPGAVVRHELGVDNGARRVDVAVLNGHFAGWEIKSDRDTLARLGDQAEAFGKVMDYLTIVTTAKFLARVEQLLPKEWGVVEAAMVTSSDSVKLTQRRRPRVNRNTDPLAIAQLLWRDETWQELKLRGLEAGLSSKPRYRLWAELSRELPKNELRSVVLNRLKQRPSWSGGLIRTPGDD